MTQDKGIELQGFCWETMPAVCVTLGDTESGKLPITPLPTCLQVVEEAKRCQLSIHMWLHISWLAAQLQLTANC